MPGLEFTILALSISRLRDNEQGECDLLAPRARFYLRPFAAVCEFASTTIFDIMPYVKNVAKIFCFNFFGIGASKACSLHL